MKRKTNTYQRLQRFHVIFPTFIIKHNTIDTLKSEIEIPSEKFELAFTRYRNNLKTVGNLTVTNSVQNSDVKEIASRECLQDTTFKKCWLHFRLRNLLFSKSTGKNVPVSCERDAYPSHFLPFSKYTGFM